MYNINDEAFAIREAQRFLFIISEHDNIIPSPAIDGIYSDEFSDNIKIYQKTRGLNVDGRVDKETFDLLFFESQELSRGNEAEKLVRTPENFLLRLGDYGSDISTLNNILEALRTHYLDVPEVSPGNFFRKSTEDAVKYMQIVFGEIDTGIVSASLLARLRLELNEREKFIV